MKPLARAGAVTAAVAVAAAALAGCGNQTTSPGAAAIVGGSRISTQTLQDTVRRSLVDPRALQNVGNNRADWTRKELARLINNVLIAKAAAAHHVIVTDNEIDQEISQLAQQYGGVNQLYQQAAQNGVPRQDLRDFVRYFVLQQKLGDALVANVPVSQAQLQAAYQQNIDQFQTIHTQHILVSDQALANRLLQQVKSKPSSFAALAAKYSQDPGSKGKGGDIGFAPRGRLDQGYANAAFATPVGGYVVAHSQFGWHVIHVLGKKTVPLSQAAPQLKADILKQQRDALLAQALVTEAKQLGVHVNPRFGAWDARQRSVVPASAKSDISSPAPSSSG